MADCNTLGTQHSMTPGHGQVIGGEGPVSIIGLVIHGEHFGRSCPHKQAERYLLDQVMVGSEDVVRDGIEFPEEGSLADGQFSGDKQQSAMDGQTVPSQQNVEQIQLLVELLKSDCWLQSKKEKQEQVCSADPG